MALWSGPRNVSTALMYAFGQRPDMNVLDEPLFGHFLEHTGVWRPSREEVLAQMETDGGKLLKSFEQPAHQPYLFLKNMANHITGLSLKSLLRYKNIILIRHPARVLSSYTQHIEAPTELDLGYKHQLGILEFLNREEQPFFILDSDDVVANPEQALRALCAYLEIPFLTDMLTWPAGPKPEDGVWAKYWYENVHKSTGFQKSLRNKAYRVPDHLQPLLTSSVHLFQKIKQYEQIQPS